MRNEVRADSGIKSFTVEAVVTRADGTVENLGVISEWYRNPLKRLYMKFKRKVTR